LHATRCPVLASSIDTQREQNSLAKNRMREICTSGSVGGEGGNVLTYPASWPRGQGSPDYAALHPGYAKPPRAVMLRDVGDVVEGDEA
jgi:hypothetical protein